MSTIDRYQKLLLQHCRENLLLRISLVLVFHRVLQLQRANNIQFGEWPFVSVALVSRDIQQWNQISQILKRIFFFSMQVIIVKLISFSKLLTSSEFIFWSFSNQESEKKSLTSVRQAASKTKLLIEKRERKYFIGSLTTFSCVIQHSVAKQMLWSKNHQLFLFPVGTVWQHKPLLPLKKNSKKLQGFLFRSLWCHVIMRMIASNSCCARSVHWLRPVGKIWISHNSWNRSS